MKKLLLPALAVLFLASCAGSAGDQINLSDIDLSGLETGCASNCVNNYASCTDRASAFSFGAECKNILKLCSQTCKPRK
jgi:hypothetical protein